MNQHFFFVVVFLYYLSSGCERMWQENIPSALWQLFLFVSQLMNKKNSLTGKHLALWSNTEPASQILIMDRQTEAPPALLTEGNTVSAKCALSIYAQINGWKGRIRWAGRRDAALHRLHLHNTESNKMCSHCLTTTSHGTADVWSRNR